MGKLPLIGLTADFEARASGATEAEYVLRSNYAEAISAAGGLPVILPCDVTLAAHYAGLLDGIVVTGGMFDIAPEHYGEKQQGPLVTKPKRTDFELALLTEALRLDLAILGICNGMQLLAVKLGGKLVQDIQRDIKGALDHLIEPVPKETAHGITIAPNSQMARITNLNTAQVNSLHHQSVKPAARYVAAATCSEDGVIEAIEVPDRYFCMGVQWHPEYHTSAVDRALLRAFVDAAKSQKGI